MRAYGKIETGFWQNLKIRKLSDSSKLLLAYCYSTPHGNSVGCFVLPDGYIMADMGWPIERVSEHLRQLVSEGFIERDQATNLVRIIGWFEHNTIENDNVAKAAIKTIKALPVCKTSVTFFKELERWNNKFISPYVNALRNVFGNGSSNPDPDPEPKPDPKPEPKKEALPCAKTFFQKCFDLAIEHFPNLTPCNVSTIYAWETAGYDFERHIKPALDSAKRKGASPRSFNFFTGAIEDSAKVKLAPALRLVADGESRELSADEAESQRRWYRKNGIQHVKYNPEGVREACA